MRTYYGNSEPEGETVTVGGDELVVGGWAAYELDRRSYRPDRAQYGGRARSAITARDVIESLFSGAATRIVGGGTDSGDDALAKASSRLDSALGRLAATPVRLTPGAVHAIVPSTRADVRRSPSETDVERLRAVGGDFSLVAACLGGAATRVVGGGERSPVPELPSGSADPSDPAEVRQLEAACASHAAAVEQARARTASQFNHAAVAIERLLDSPRSCWFGCRNPIEKPQSTGKDG